MKRAVMTALTAALVTGIAAARPPETLASARLADSQAAAPGDANREMRLRQCRFQWLDQAMWTAREERRTALCVLDRWPVPGGWTIFNRVADCESHWYRFASNGGDFLGLFQHQASAWPSRVVHYMPAGWRIGPWTRWANSRSAIVTTARMVHASWSWSAWSCY